MVSAFAVSLTAMLSTTPANAAAFKAKPILGSDLIEACGSNHSDEHCAGFISAVQVENGDRFLKRNCPPALVRGETAYVDQVRAYLKQHPSWTNRLARDLVFEAETAELSRLLGTPCKETR
jgi:hypothetical protein